MNARNIKVNKSFKERIVNLKEALNILMQPIPFEFKTMLFWFDFKIFVLGYYYKQIPTGKCVYCNIDKATKFISNPNMSEIDYWAICDNCDTVIKLQQELSLRAIIGDDKGVEKLQYELALKHPDAVTFTIKKKVDEVTEN